MVVNTTHEPCLRTPIPPSLVAYPTPSPPLSPFACLTTSDPPHNIRLLFFWMTSRKHLILDCLHVETLKNFDFSSARASGFPTIHRMFGLSYLNTYSTTPDYGAVGVCLRRWEGSPTIFNLLIPLVVFDPTTTLLHTTYGIRV